VLQITRPYLFKFLHSFIIWIYLISIFVFKKLMFYPIGIPLTLYVVFWINFALIKAAIDIVKYTKHLYYNLIDLYSLFYFLGFYLRYVIPSFNTVYQALLNIFKVYVNYYFIFFFKRIEIHFFWLSYIIFYC
jgi:hypothetical protein